MKTIDDYADELAELTTILRAAVAWFDETPAETLGCARLLVAERDEYKLRAEELEAEADAATVRFNAGFQAHAEGKNSNDEPPGDDESDWLQGLAFAQFHDREKTRAWRERHPVTPRADIGTIGDRMVSRDECPVCHWPLAATKEEGCVPGNCSYRGAK